MPVKANLFIHESDKAALEALKAVPGFSQVVKAYMSAVSENQMRIRNISTNVRLSEKQLPKYYNMLLPICEKMGIDVPELYLELNPFPNAYTSGETKPFIVMTSGLLETIPEELIPTVLAHECGHSVCHHVLYRTMGSMILNGALGMFKIPGVALYPIQAAFSYWMRCSEYSADRVAVVCDGGAEKTAEVCARLAGFDKDILGDINMDAFLEQAVEYKEMTKDSKWNKFLDVTMNYANTHPLNAVRAYEAMEWAKTEKFQKVNDYLQSEGSSNFNAEYPLPWNAKHFAGKSFVEAKAEIEAAGFEDVEMIRETEKPGFLTKPGQVLEVKINAVDSFKEGDWVSSDSRFFVTYYLPLTDEEIAAMHPGESRMPFSNKICIGKQCEEAVEKLKEAGFANIVVEEQKDIEKSGDKNIGKVSNITVDRLAVFSKDDWFDSEAEIVLTYHALIEG